MKSTISIKTENAKSVAGNPPADSRIFCQNNMHPDPQILNSMMP